MLFLLFPLLCGILYAIGSLFLKRALGQGIGPWRMIFVSNLTIALFSLPFLFSAPPPTADAHGWQPILGGLSFFIGQLCTFFAIHRGDVSVATPVLGTKVIFVALFTVFMIHVAIPWTWWVAALLTTLAIALLGGGPQTDMSRRQFRQTVLFSGLAALSYSFTDVATQKWAPAWTSGGYSARFFGVSGILSLGLIPFFTHRLSEVRRETWGWLLSGTTIMAANGLMLYLAIGTYGHATAINIVYNARGLFTVFLVWAVGHWFDNQEGKAGAAVLIRRTIGSALLLAAIGLVLQK